ncbi:MAG: glycosyltransferase family 2 protein [Planctomycetota bacterium]
MTPDWLTALPVFNESRHLCQVLDEVLRYSSEVLVVDDGSTDETHALLSQRRDIQVVTHERNRGYGAALLTAFQYAIEHQFDVLVTVDCDGQHEPQRIAQFVAACQDADLISGSRYLNRYAGDMEPPRERRAINEQLTGRLNQQLGLNLTDAFCGFKAYRVEALKPLRLRERGYAMPLELWVQAVVHGLRIIELPVPLIYLEQDRCFGGSLDDGTTRLRYYHQVLNRSLQFAWMDQACNVDVVHRGEAG